MTPRNDVGKIPNPERGCGHIEPGKAYIRGVAGIAAGVLPAFVKLEDPIPFREIGTSGSFTRSFKKIDGLSLQTALSESHIFTPLGTHGEYGDSVFERMADKLPYNSRMEIPEREVDRHLDRLRFRSDELTPPGFEDGDWGRMDLTDQTDLLMRAGESYYPTAESFIEEARRFGLSKAIPVSATRDPPTIIPGITRCWVMCPNAGDNDYGGAVIGYAYIGEIVFTRPEDGDVPAYIEEYEQNGSLNIVDVAEPQTEEEDPGPANMTISEAVNGGDTA
jgi:hypothetical protein